MAVLKSLYNWLGESALYNMLGALTCTMLCTMESFHWHWQHL